MNAKRMLPVIALLAAALTFFGCSTDGDTGGGKDTPSVTKVTISGGESVNVGNSITLTANPDVTPKSSVYTWTVENNHGEVTYTDSKTATLKLIGKKEGTVIVTASVDGVKSAEHTVTVVGAGVVLPNSISLDPETLSLKAGGTAMITATIGNADKVTEGYDRITWNSSDESVVELLSKEGATVTVKANKAGNATITASAGSVNETCAVKVIVVTGVTLKTTLTLYASDSTILTATVNGTNLTDADKAVSWKSSEVTVATVSENGQVRAVAKGETTITATSKADSTKSATCTVKVLESGYTIVDTWNFVGQTDAAYSDLGEKKSDGNLGAESLPDDNDISVKGDENDLTLTLTKAGTGKGKTKSSPKYKYRAEDGLCIKGAALKIENVPAGARLTIEWSTLGSSSRNLEVTVGADNTVETAINDSGDQADYVTTIGSSQTVYIGASNELYIRRITIDSESGSGPVLPSAITLSETSLALDLSTDEKTATLTATIANADKVSEEYKTIEWKSSDESVVELSSKEGTTVTVTAKKAGSATITASTENNQTADCTVVVSNGRNITLTDEPVGYASLGTSYATSGGKTVRTRSELINALSDGGVIIIDGMIDMSEGKLVPEGSVSTNSTTALDDFVKNKSSGKYQTYAAWVEAYSEACDLLTEDDEEYNASKSPFKDNSAVKNSELYSDVQTLNKAYGDTIKLTLKSNTTLIGKGPGCGIRGGTIQINSVSNIQIRNLTIQDAFDPFPHHEVDSKAEKTDGYNAQWDGVNIQGTCSNIWIDHCTFEDTIDLGYVQTSGNSDSMYKEKWQTYDGLCDLKNNTTNVTISNCVFRDHDKTMLMGSSDSDGDSSKRFVTLYGNYFYNCGQRLPMVRNTTIHILNNYYDASSPHYSQQYAVGVRKNAIIYAEGNYFGSGIQYSFKDNDGTLYYASDNTDNSSRKTSTTVKGPTLFSSAVGKYTYTAVSANEAKTNAENNAGAGYTLQLQ